MNWFRDHIDPKYLKICAYASITTLATIAVGLLIYHSGGLLITGRDLIGAVATPIVYGMLLCYILLPLVRGITDWLARRNIFKDNFSARLHIGVFITVALVLLLVSAIICLLVVVITRSAENINMETLQALWSSAEGDIMRLITMAQEKLAELGFIEMSSGTGITGTLGEVTDVLSTVVVSIIIGVYFLLDGRRIVSYLKRIFVALFGEYIGPDLTQVLQDADAAFSGYLRGQVVDALLVGTVVAVSYTLISVPYGPIIGLLTGIGNLIPYIGGPVGYITTILVCLAEGNIRKLVAGVICLSVIMFIDGNLINPRLLSHAVEVHPLVVILALVAGINNWTVRRSLSNTGSSAGRPMPRRRRTTSPAVRPRPTTCPRCSATRCRRSSAATRVRAKRPCSSGKSTSKSLSSGP